MAMEWKTESVSARREAGVSNSLTLPASRRRILWLSMMVLSRWAMVSTVQPVNSERMVAWMRSSVSRSTAAVASSRIRIFVLPECGSKF